MSDEFPAVIGKYKVSGIVAKGGMGVVYKAIHPSLKRYVVIKKMTARGKSTNAERFKKEAQILLDLQSPYIVHLFDYFTESDFRYMVEEFVDGAALDNLIKKQTTLPCPIAMLIMQDACYALKYAHSKEIVHRDIKPGNILISKRGEIKLADFGIASDSSEGDNVTQTGMALGTPAYMPPEQFEDSASVDNRADIYALGIMLYEMVTGTKPYPQSFSIETLNTIKKGKYINPRKIDKKIPHILAKLIHKMIRPKAKSRFHSVDGVLKIVKKYLKHYDTHEIRVQLAKSVLNSKTYEYPFIEQKGKLKRRIFKSVWICAIFIAAILFSWKMGFFHKTILKKWYTPVQIEMEMPLSLSGQMDLPVKAFFFENDNDIIPEISGSERTLFEKGSRFWEKILFFGDKMKDKKSDIKNVKNTENKIYSMKKLFLKHGKYRVKVVVGPYVWWKSFEVSKENCLITCDFLKNIVREIKIKTYSYDSKSGENISEKTNFLIFCKNKWVNINEIDSKEIKSGAVWKIKAVCEGYNEEFFSLLIDWYQDELIISAMLEAK